MNPNSLQDVLETSEMLADKGKYEQALVCLETVNCVMGEWLKGKIYLESALQMSNSFAFKNYPTAEMKSKHRDMLNAVYNHLYNAALMLPTATDDIKNQLNKCLWDQIAKVQNELSSMKIIVESEDDPNVYGDDDEQYQQLHTENLIDDISQWTF